jgi:hypothetical protein
MIKEGYTRVTDIISRYSGIESIPKDLLDRAAHRGTLTHKYIEGVVNGSPCPFIPPEIECYVNGFEEFWKVHETAYGKHKMETEVRLYDEERMITGCIDLVQHTDNGIILYDWKTSSRPQKTWRLQGAAYRWLAEKIYPNISKFIFVHLKKDGKYSLKEYDTHVEDLETFLKCCDLFDWFDMKKRKNVDTED